MQRIQAPPAEAEVHHDETAANTNAVPIVRDKRDTYALENPPINVVKMAAGESTVEDEKDGLVNSSVEDADTEMAACDVPVVVEKSLPAKRKYNEDIAADDDVVPIVRHKRLYIKDKHHEMETLPLDAMSVSAMKDGYSGLVDSPHEDAEIAADSDDVLIVKERSLPNKCIHGDNAYDDAISNKDDKNVDTSLSIVDDVPNVAVDEDVGLTIPPTPMESHSTSSFRRTSNKRKHTFLVRVSVLLAAVYLYITQSLMTNLGAPQTRSNNLVLPNILLIGAQKAGTTSIATLLYSNGICNAQTFPGEPDYFTKEVHYFDEYYNEGIEFYAKRFNKCVREHRQFILDATPNYLNESQRVYETYTIRKAKYSMIASLKLICILRDPVARELSWYNHKVMFYNLGKKFDWVIDVAHENATIKSFDDYSNDLVREIVNDPSGSFSLYADHLKEWVKLFGRQRLLILSYQELLERPSMIKQRIEAFIGINLTGRFSHENVNDNPAKVHEMSSQAKTVLGVLFRRKNDELYQFLYDNPGPPMEQNPFPLFVDEYLLPNYAVRAKS